MRSPRILIVDDSKLVRTWCTRILEKHGMEVQSCPDGKEGVKRVFSFLPDVVLMDLEMPVMDGISAIKRLKEHEQTEHIPVVAFTAKTGLEEKVGALEAGANDFLHKETDEAELIARVKSQVRIKRLEDGFIRERNKFFNILNDLGDAVVIIDHEEQIIFLNNSASLVLNVAGKPYGEMKIEDLIYSSAKKDEFVEALKKGELENFELELGDRKQKKQFTVSSGQVYVSSETMPGMALVFRDVTHEKKMEEMKAAFYSMIAHDLRSPIAVINGYIKLLLSGKTGELSSIQKEFLSDTRDRANAMLKLVDEFLTVTKFETSYINLELQEVDISAILKEAIKSLSFIAKDKNIRVKFEKTDEIPRITADPDKLHKVFINLYDNALKYTMEGGEIVICISRSSDGVQVEIADTGIGIDAEELQYVFDRFKRMATAKGRKIKGTGLGLAIVKEIVDAHRGRVWVESEAGKGSSFYVLLPSGKEALAKKAVKKTGIKTATKA